MPNTVVEELIGSCLVSENRKKFEELAKRNVNDNLVCPKGKPWIQKSRVDLRVYDGSQNVTKNIVKVVEEEECKNVSIARITTPIFIPKPIIKSPVENISEHTNLSDDENFSEDYGNVESVEDVGAVEIIAPVTSPIYVTDEEFDVTDDDEPNWPTETQFSEEIVDNAPTDEIVEARNTSHISREVSEEARYHRSDSHNASIRCDDDESDIEADTEEKSDYYDDSFESSDDEEIVQAPQLNLDYGNMVHIINELVTTESDYIRNLKIGLDNYYTIMVDKTIPIHLKGQKYIIFGVIKKIYEFHSEFFYPALQASSGDVAKLANAFKLYADKGNFYLYVLYAMNKPRSESIVFKGAEFFKAEQIKLDDKLGVQSFLMQPIQRLPKYNLIIQALIKELVKHTDKNEIEIKKAIAACCIAQSEIQRVLDAANVAVAVNDIIVDEKCYVNVGHQGKFLGVGEFNIGDPKSRRKYLGKIFLFKKSIVYCEKMDDKSLLCRGCYRQETMGIRLDDTKKKRFYLFTNKSGNEELEFNNTKNNNDDWAGRIREMMERIVEAEIKKIQDSRSRPASYIASCLRMSAISNSNRDSSGSMTSGIWSNRSSHSSYSSNEMNKSTWTQRKDPDRICNSERYYLQAIYTNQKIYLDKIGDRAMQSFRVSLTNIYNCHKSLYAKIKVSGTELIHIFNHLVDAINDEQLIGYIEYSTVAVEAEQYLLRLKHLFTNATIDIYEFVHLPLNRILYYVNLVNTYLSENQQDNWNTPTFKVATKLAINLNKLNQTIQENYKLHNLKQNKFIIADYKSVRYSDIVSLDTFDLYGHRIFIMEAGIICVRFREETSSKDEVYKDIAFNVVFPVQIVVSRKNRNKINLINSSVAKLPGIVFKTHAKTEQFCKMVLSHCKPIL